MKQSLTILQKSNLLGREFTIYGTAENPLFLAKDVAEVINHSNITAMIASVDEDERVIGRTKDSLGRDNGATFLTEDGLYEVLILSRKPIAKEFKKGVKEILKSIRKNGAYMTEQTLERALTEPDFLIQLATQLKEERNKRLLAEVVNCFQICIFTQAKTTVSS